MAMERRWSQKCAFASGRPRGTPPGARTPANVTDSGRSGWQHSLHDACCKERIAGYDSQVVVEAFRSILLCAKDLHESGVVHADLKQR